MDEEGSTLDFVTTEELVQELASRFQSLVVIGLRDVTEDDEASQHWMFGGQMTCLGLLTAARARMIQDYLADGETFDA